MTTVNVTAGHIAEGLRDSCELCPVALAIRQAFPRAGAVYVDSTYVTFGHRGSWTEVGLPDAATQFIEAFDRDDPAPPPFTFELDYPEARPAA